MGQPSDDREAIRRALACFDGLEDAAVEPLGRGLINRTYRVRTGGAPLVLQRVNPIFDPLIHHNIRAVTTRLAACGLETPRLIEERGGAPFVDLGADGVWRLMTFVDGVTFDVVAGAAQARAAGRLVARFHAALDGLRHEFVGARLGVHDTLRHLDALRRAIGDHAGHRLHAEVRPLADSILAAAERLPALPALAPRICHGDLKFNNLLFAGATGAPSRQALCVVDLDTVGPMALAFELGDAFRSWCNPRGEDSEDALFDLGVFAAALDGYLDGLGRVLIREERAAVLHGVEWISLELAARFAADALDERYFGWDRARFRRPGEHNLLRARSQWSLHCATIETRGERAHLLGLAAA